MRRSKYHLLQLFSQEKIKGQREVERRMDDVKEWTDMRKDFSQQGSVFQNVRQELGTVHKED